MPSRQVKISMSSLATKGKKQSRSCIAVHLIRGMWMSRLIFWMRSYPVIRAALAISIADAKACEVQFDQAGWNGTPIVTFDSSSDYPGISAFVSTDNSSSATEAANRLAGGKGESGEVMFLCRSSKSR